MLYQLQAVYTVFAEHYQMYIDLRSDTVLKYTFPLFKRVCVCACLCSYLVKQVHWVTQKSTVSMLFFLVSVAQLFVSCFLCSVRFC